MPFIEGFITAIPTANREAFLDHAKKVVHVFQDFGAGRIVDAWGDDVPRGETTDFHRAVEAKEDEAIGFGWIEYADRATRDAASEKMMSDSRMAGIGEMPFDGQRMIFGGFEPVVDRGEGGKAGYIEGFVGAVPTANKEKFIDHAEKAAPLFLSGGALRVVECWGADVPKGKVTDFYRSVKAADDETVIFSWVEWPDKATRAAGQEKLFAEMDAHMKDNPMPFDARRMIFGGFEIINDSRG
ncbi:DUF1428 domain-containing protein [Aquamicrobium ahrensii]|uniref:Uncharacterized protein YbaA (DUF1428 family) n=1 Tax=Aquamicrobium ahrensii TaxID=469551 RepID=A0ABV2KS35_9HYPH